MTPSLIVAKNGFSTPLITTASVRSEAARPAPWRPSAHPAAQSRSNHATGTAGRGRRVVSDRRLSLGTTTTLDVAGKRDEWSGRPHLLVGAVQRRGNPASRAGGLVSQAAR